MKNSRLICPVFPLSLDSYSEKTFHSRSRNCLDILNKICGISFYKESTSNRKIWDHFLKENRSHNALRDNFISFNINGDTIFQDLFNIRKRYRSPAGKLNSILPNMNPPVKRSFFTSHSINKSEEYSIERFIPNFYDLPLAREYPSQKEALEVAKKLLHDNPKDLNASLLTIKVLIDRKEFNQAFETIESLDNAEQRNPLVLFFKTKIYTELKQYDQALETSNILSSIDDGWIPYYLKIPIFIAKENWKEVQDCAEQILRVNPKHSQSWLALARASAILNSPQKVKYAITEFEKLGPYEDYYLLLSAMEYYLEVKCIAEALELFDKVMESSKKNNSTNSADDLIGNYLYSIKNFELVDFEKFVSKFLQYYPKNEHIYKLILNRAMGEFNWHLVINYAQKMVENIGYNNVTSIFQACAYYQTNKTEEALDICERILVKDPKYFDAIGLKLFILINRNEPKNEVVDLIKNLEKIEIKIPTELVAIKRALMEESVKDALEIINSELNKDADSFNIFTIIFNDTLMITQLKLLYKLGDWKKYIECSETLINRYPTNCMLNLDLSYAHIALNEFEKAIEILKSLEPHEPNQPQLYYNLALAQSGISDHDNTIISIEKLLKLEPNNSLAWAIRGLVFNEKGNRSEAASSFLKAFQLTQDEDEKERLVRDVNNLGYNLKDMSY